ncbi:class II fructose-bisphosphate aldolase [Aminobacterium mobile]|uniref:class II fructose-bisphosphate aldolase n=1 Tax=Aminobacterium mobile TaxID=81467 RepID=UPI0004630BFF|nr:class II fructose-bisphosphate aldolase [Aminobacterium mobile]
MRTNSASYKEMLKKRPLNVQALWGNEEVGLVSGRDIVRAFREANAIILAANARNPLTVKGVFRAAKKLNAAVFIEIAKSESTYCAGNFDNLPEYAVKTSSELGHGVIFGLHVDHYAIKSEADLFKAVSHIPSVIQKGWTSVAIDASHLPDWENLCNTRDVAMHIPAYLGLEVEVGEIKGPGELTTVEEAKFFIGGLNAWGIFPDLLAISNGSLHGTYDTGQQEGIDLDRTLEIAQAIRPYGVSIAQHGISGTPIEKVAKFAKYGINKGNVATLFQNIVFGIKMDPDTGNAITEKGSYVKESHRGVSEETWKKIVEWCDAQGYSRKDGNYKKSNLPMGKYIMNESPEIIGRIIDETEEWATRFIKAFNAENSAEKVLEVISRRQDYNGAPEQAILGARANYNKETAPDLSKKDNKDYSD